MKNPVSSTLNRVSLALAVFIKRPQAETQIGASRKLLWTLDHVNTSRVILDRATREVIQNPFSNHSTSRWFLACARMTA
jgi:hypothetical protein